MADRDRTPHARAAERDRRAYERSARKRSAWKLDNPGNAAARQGLADAVASALTDLESRRLLDVGCGSGWLLRELITRGARADRVAGVDLAESRLKAARDTLPGVRFVSASAVALPFEDTDFAAVTMISLLSSLRADEGWRRALCEAHRVLAPGGKLVIYEQAIPNPLNRRTRLIRGSKLESALGELGMSVKTARITLLPPVSRRLGGQEGLRAALSRVTVLRSHRLFVAQAEDETR